MESTAPKLGFVRCAKCFEVLKEPPGITVYKCGGCGATLLSGVHPSSGELLSSASAAGSSKNISDSSSQVNQKENFEKRTPSDHIGDKDHVSSGERNVEEFSGNAMNTHVADLNGANLKEKLESPVYVKNGIKGTTLEKENKTETGIPSKTKNNLIKELKVSSDLEIPAANNSMNSNDKLEESSESLEYDTSSKDNKINGNYRKDTSFLLRKNSHAYDSSFSSIDAERRKQIPQKYLNLSRRTFGRRTSSVISGQVTPRNGVHAREQDFSFISEDFQSARNWMESENDSPSISKSKDHAKQFVKFRYSEKDDKVKIIKKVDELKSELLEYFHRTAVDKDDSQHGLTAQFEEKIQPQQYRSSSLISLSKQPKSSCSNTHYGDICNRNEHSKPCHHNACCNLPERTTIRPLHMKCCPSLHHEPQNPQSNDKKKQQAVKRHCRPVSGGAPFVICYKCYKLLQLPADFLVSTKRVHKLRCGSCYEVLRYFYRSRALSIQRTPAEAQHPPSESENNVSGLVNEIRVGASNELAGGDPVSYSEEYGVSFGKSYSYEAEPSRQLGRYDGIVEEEESGRKGSGSQLHRLMGYSSARYLLFENLSPGDGHRIEQDR
ncbi:protein ENHANCED DISEASE RESISTANCE 4-like [Phalaenopsis equestris]|uniref:protein ENHANCED DISEASE RESISTANCE 4-like n=1 Tax=Phalaenopsis equestris TaxID=78828 RepID=UPI0009E63E94|nr:protein ENHANCED DISEASE RESISTANCE 4-like [Phalaenopsis equestris]XP_020572772.1 protein ENHANCED DISEASE RESISTANCE 4-like [Phalaenopsis equestris]